MKTTEQLENWAATKPAEVMAMVCTVAVMGVMSGALASKYYDYRSKKALEASYREANELVQRALDARSGTAIHLSDDVVGR